MPHLETGERVDIKFNTLGVFNRLNIFQLYEQSINFITERTVQKFINENTSIPEMEKIVFRILEIFNPEECIKMKDNYKKKCTTKKAKEEFFNIIKEKGIFIHIKPYWHGENIYECVKKCYEEFEWIKPYKCYFYEEHSQRWVRMMNDQIVGSMYVMKLKQSSKKNMSACSNAPINNLGLPSKNDNAKKHRSLYPKTPIRSGLQETINNMISISPEVSAQLHMYYRSSPVARRKLGIEIINNYGKGLPIEPVTTDKMTNRNVEILSAYLKIMGLQLVFDDDIVHLPTTEEGRKDNRTYFHKYKGDSYLASPDFMLHQLARDKALEKMDDNEIGYIYIGGDGSYKEQVIEELTRAIEADMLELGPDEYFRREGDIIKY